MINSLRYLGQKFRRLATQLPHLERSFRIIFAAARGWTVAWICLLLLQGFLPVVTVYLTKILVNSIAAAVAGNADASQIRQTLFLVVLMATIQLLAEGLRAASGWVRATQAELIQDYVADLIHRKSVDVDLAIYDSPEFYDRLHRAQMDATHRPTLLLENMGALLQNGITLLAMAAVLVPFGLWLPAALFLSTIPAVVVAIRYIDRQHEWFIRNTAKQRKTWYYSYLMIDRVPAAELRLFHLGDLFHSSYMLLRRQLREERLKLLKQQSVGELLAGMAGYLISGIAMAVMVWRAVRQLITLGDLALFYQAFSQGQRLMRTLLDSLRELYKNSLFLENLFEFLELRPQILNPSQPVHAPSELKSGIGFHDVTYRYPGSDRLAIEKFNLQIEANKVVAIVGPNGAGKSTLIKLLCRLYDPDEGHIELDGIDLRKYDVEKLRRLITVLFQEPVHYNDTVSRNILYGDSEISDQKSVHEAANAAGADEIIENLPHKYDTLLGTSFIGGSELSVGEWQRISLARAFLRQAPVILLDEPTSAMDTWAEAEWMARFRFLTEGRTAIIITHRFTTAMQADIIHVMQKGHITESGCHEELLELGGEYARSWNSQMRARAVKS